MTSSRGFVPILAACMLVGCYAANGGDQADTSTSWLRECSSSSECDHGSDCVEGWCTMPRADATGAPAESSTSDASGVASSAPTQDATGSGEPSDGAAESGEPPDPNAPFFEIDGISFDRSAAVGWAGDHWVVSWVTYGTEAGQGNSIHLAQVSAGGEVELHSAPFPNRWPGGEQLTFSAEGALAVATSGEVCTLETFAPNVLTEPITMTFPCSGDGARVSASSIPGSPDWLVAYGTGEHDDASQFHGSIVAGRYLAQAGAWAAMPELGARTQEDTLSVFVAGEDAVVVWGNPAGSTLQRASALATAQAGQDMPDTWSEPIALDAKTISDSGYGFASLEQGQLLFHMDGAALGVHVIEPHGVITLHEVARSTIRDRVPGVAAAPELGIAGVCYARGPGPYIGGPVEAEPDVPGDSMWFVIVNASGAAITEPVMLADGLADNTGCGVAWSGERFFAVTWGIFQGFVEQRWTATAIRGLLIDPPAP